MYGTQMNYSTTLTIHIFYGRVSEIFRITDLYKPWHIYIHICNKKLFGFTKIFGCVILIHVAAVILAADDRDLYFFRYVKIFQICSYQLVRNLGYYLFILCLDYLKK